MKKLLLGASMVALIAASWSARAQSDFSIPGGGIPTAHGFNVQGESKVDGTDGIADNLALDGGNATGLAIDQTSTLSLPGMPGPVSISLFFDAVPVVPDWFQQPGDNGNDTLEINRAITAECQLSSGRQRLLFRSRHYLLKTQVQQSCALDWDGEGFQEQPTTIAGAPGTWFDVDGGFIGSSSPVILFSGSAQGAVVQDVAFDEPSMTAPPTAVYTSGQLTGWSPSTWSPAAFPQIIQVTGATGMEFRHLMFDGVNAGIVISGSGRSNTYDIRGQAFAYLVNNQELYDVSRIIDVHDWVFWSAADPVVQYQQANTSVVVSLRNDTPFWDRIFAFGVENGVLIDQQADGTTTGAQIGHLECDFTLHCLHIATNAIAVQLQLDAIRSYGQKWNQVSGAPVTMLPGSDIIHMDGAGILQLGQFESFGIDAAEITLTNSTFLSNINIASLYGVLTRQSANSTLVVFPSSGSAGSTVSLGNMMLTADAPSGFALTNTGGSKTGVGSLLVTTGTLTH